MASRWDIKCSASRCPFKRLKIESKKDAERHAAAHRKTCGELHQVAIDEVKPLSKRLRVGDRVKVKKDRATELRAEAARAGWQVDTEAIRIVERLDNFGPGGGKRAFVEGPPYAFNSRDVDLAWNDDDERRRGLGL